MRFSVEVASYFIGQDRAISNLALLAEEILEGHSYNVLFVAPSGWGKTYLAKLFLEFLDPGYKNSLSYDPTQKNLRLDASKKFHFIDEAHTVTVQEQLYGFLSSQNHVVVLTTNNYDQLLEPLVNRCEVIHFEPYTVVELGKIAYLVFKRRGFEKLPFKIAKLVGEYSRGTPRITERLANRVCGYFQHVGIPQTREAFDKAMEETLGIIKGGFTELDNQYLKALEDNDGRASLSLIANSTGIPQNYIKTNLEPFLINKKLVKITPRGRILRKEKDD